MFKRVFSSLLAAVWLCSAMAAGEKEADTKKKPEVDPKVIQEIFNCVASGLPKDWKRTWVVVTELRNERGTRQFEADFFYSSAADSSAGEPLQPCDKDKVAREVYSLNKFLPTYEQRQWKQATLVFNSDGTFNLKYDYSR
jgi:hypothetical protein